MVIDGVGRGRGDLGEVKERVKDVPTGLLRLDTSLLSVLRNRLNKEKGNDYNTTKNGEF